VALAVPRPDGTLPRDRKGRSAPRRVVLAADGTRAQAVCGVDPALIDDTDWRWITAVAWRRWATVTSRLNDRAWPSALALTRAGVLTLDCAVTGLQLGPPTMVRLTSEWAVRVEERGRDRVSEVADWRRRAAALASEVKDLDSALAEYLESAKGYERHLPVFVAAGEDLLAGVVHDGPRAFSQTHFGNTKVRDDAPDILTGAGVSPLTLAALGLTRSPYLGLGGAVTVTGSTGQSIDLVQFAGPIRFRADPVLALLRAQLTHADGTLTLAIVENLQAAETVCDVYGSTLAVAWCAGQPAERPLALMASLAVGAGRVLVAPDADLGGVRIANRIVNALPRGTDVRILDAGAAAHEPGEPFSTATSGLLAALEATAADQRVRTFAAAVGERGYPVEQEACVRAVLTTAPWATYCLTTLGHRARLAPGPGRYTLVRRVARADRARS